MTHTRKVVYNACYGGFGLSEEASELYLQRKGIPYEKGEKGFSGTSFNKPGGDNLYDELNYMDRHDPDLVDVVEELGSKASGMWSNLEIATVNGLYRIEEYDGMETVIENYGDWC